MDTLQDTKKQEVEREFSMSCPKCTKIHPQNECPLKNIEICALCEGHIPTEKISFPSLKVVYQGIKGSTKSVCFTNQKRPIAPRPYQQRINYNPSRYFNNYPTYFKLRLGVHLILHLGPCLPHGNTQTNLLSLLTKNSQTTSLME